MHLFLYWLFIQLSSIATGIDGYSSHFVQTAQGRVHYIEAQGQGDLPPFLLFHGLGCQSRDLYPVMRHLRKYTRKLISVDLPAHGQTDIPIDTLSVAQIQSSFYEGLDQILSKEAPVLLFGNSLGGWQALNYADYHPQELSGLIVVSPAGAAMQPEQHERLLKIFGHDSIQEPHKVIPLLFNKTPAQSDLVADIIKAQFSYAPTQSLLRKLGPENTLIPEKLNAIKLPTLLIWGQQDRIFPGMVDFFKQNLPAHTQILEPTHFTHSPYVEDSMDQELTEMMVTWADSLPKLNP